MKTAFNRRCPRCHKPASACACEDICNRCLFPRPKCRCEESLRPLRAFAPDESKFQMDEDVEDELRRQYGDRSESPSDTYWHGYNYTRKVGKKTQVRCPYTSVEERREFYRGVSDARSSL